MREFEDAPFACDGDRLRLRVRATPRARRSEIVGVVPDSEGRLLVGVRLAAPPVEGAANKALINLLAELLGVARSHIRIVAGETARQKLVEIRGDPAALAARLDTLMDA